MRKWKCLLLIVVAVMVFYGPSVVKAAHFSLTGTSHLSDSGSKTFTQIEWCNFDYSRNTSVITIDPDGSENIGDPVTIDYCYSVTGSTTTPGAPYVAIAGVGDASSFNVACLPQPPKYTAPSNPATLILNPGPTQTTIISYPPRVLTGNETVSLNNQCGTIHAHIGDTIQGNVGLFVLVYDTRGFPAGGAGQGVSASIHYTIDADIISSTLAVETWTGTFSFTLKVTSEESNNPGTQTFLTSNQPFAGTLSLYVGDNGLTKNAEGCYLKFLSDDRTKIICITDIAAISTESQRSKSEKAILVGTGTFTTKIEGNPFTGNVYVDLKGTLKQDSSNNLVSIGLTGKVGGGVGSDFVFSATLNNTTLTKQTGTSF